MIDECKGRETSQSTEFRFEPLRPERLDRLPPCRANCPSGNAVRDWIAAIAQRPASEAEPEAYRRAWRMLVAQNPFPATMGRICPHPCEGQCNRRDKDGAVAINELERFLGDWAIAKGLALPLEAPEEQPEHIGVIGAGPAGLSFAWQMRRRGYRVTVYDRHAQPGGMLRYGIPDYRLPPAVLDQEIGRILATGVVLRSGVDVGVDPGLEVLRSRHPVLFLGLGAQLGRRLGLDGEDVPGVWTGTGFLERHNRGERPELGEHVVVVGGGNTAIDAARVARRRGARVTLLYRRAREDMPAIEAEVAAAVEEGVVLEFHAEPCALLRDDCGGLFGIRVQRTRPGDRDASGRAAPLPVPGEVRTLLASALIAAVAQEPDWSGLECLAGVLDSTEGNGDAAGLVTGAGDLRGLDLASHAIGQARLTAERVHARLRGLPEPQESQSAPGVAVRAEHYVHAPRLAVHERPAPERLARPDVEASSTVDEDAFLREIDRCFSCGLCNGCQQCWMYCAARGFTRLEMTGPGRYFAFALDACEGCGKCIELCPTGFIGQAGGEEGN